MAVIVPQTGYSSQLILSLIHEGRSIEEAAALMEAATRDGEGVLPERSWGLFRLYTGWIEAARAEGRPMTHVAYAYSRERGLERLGQTDLAAVA